MQDPRVPHGARDRFEALYLACYPALHRYVLRRTDTADDAADVIAETFLTAWRRLGDVPDGEEATLWLYATARRVLANHRRGRSRRTALAARLRDELAANPPAGVDDPRLDTVREAFAALAPGDREVLALACWEGLSGPQIAKVLGCSAAAARLRLHRARKRMARLLHDAGGLRVTTAVLREENR